MRRAITTQSRRISEPALPQPFPDLFKLSPVHLNAAPSVTEGKDCVFVSIHVFFFLLLFFQCTVNTSVNVFWVSNRPDKANGVTIEMRHVSGLGPVQYLCGVF